MAASVSELGSGSRRDPLAQVGQPSNGIRSINDILTGFDNCNYWGRAVQFSPDIFGSAIVGVGAFNPAIFSPDWLLSTGLIGSSDREAANTAEGLLVSQQVSSMETDWFALQVVENQFALHSRGPLSPAFRDLAQGILALVPHTPITAVGLNFIGHYQMNSEEDYHRIGDVLAPKQIWRQVFSEETSDVGMADLQMIITKSKRGEAPSSC